jgi:predicted N-formylglutamate amidohydrolase
MHSFTPVLKGEVRRADVAFLYDPASQVERDLCDGWSSRLKLARPDLRVRRNYPYRGTDDGFTTALRAEFGERKYAGIELEVNQRFPLDSPKEWRVLQQDLLATFDV